MDGIYILIGAYLLIGLLVGGLLLAEYILQGAALSALRKGREFHPYGRQRRDSWKAWVPFFNAWLMGDIADEFAKYFDVENITMVLTAEASGIALATICAQKYNVPMVFAKKAKSDNIEGGLYQSEIFSYTYKKKVTQILSKEWLTSSDRVLIVDDFMANGEAVRGLCDLVSQAGAELVGIGIAVEKGFQGGGDRLRDMGVNYRALAIIERADENGIVFREEQ